MATGKRKKTDITMRPSEGWSAEPLTENRVTEIAGMIVKGVSRQTIQTYIKDNYKVQERQARAYYNAALRYLQPDDEDEYKKGLIQANINRLETIIEAGMKDNANLKIAKEAIDSLNKMLGIGGNNVAINRNKEGEETIIISFD